MRRSISTSAIWERRPVRSGYAEAAEVARLVQGARIGVARLIGAADASRIVFANNGTDALNMALYGLLRDGDHVITSEAEHNSVLRPLKHLEAAKNITITRVRCDRRGEIDPDDVRRAITDKTRLVALVHASNVTGLLQPLTEIGAIARERDVRFLVDAAQTVGHTPVNVANCSAINARRS